MRLENLNYYEVKKFDTIKEMMNMAVEEAGDKTAFMFKEKGQVKEKTYRQFQADTIYLGTA